MKYLIMCEGPNELEVIKILLEHDCLKISADDLLNLVPYHARQIKSSGVVQTALNLYPGEVTVLRIGDALNDKLQIPREYAEKIVAEEKYCTKPELEMLLIIAEGLEKEFEKVKSKVKPKTFAKEHVKCGRKAYKNDTAFYREYFGNDIERLVECLWGDKRIKGAHKKDELYLADLLKSD